MRVMQGPAPIVVRGMHGLGDNIFQRPYVRALARTHDVFLRTPWPEVYEGIDRVAFAPDRTSLRTQARNMARQPATRWRDPPERHRTITIGYGGGHLRRGSILDAMRECFRVDPEGFDLPAFDDPLPVDTSRRIAVVRPVTERREWHNSARNPLPEYVAHVAADLVARGFEVVSVADVDGSAEWLVGDPPPCTVTLHRGELNVRQLLRLIQSAAVVVGGVGWIVPAAIAARVPLFCILGGQGGHNAPDRITSQWMPLENVCFAEPDRFCRCENMRHQCDKRNSRIAEQWQAFRFARGL